MEQRLFFETVLMKQKSSMQWLQPNSNTDKLKLMARLGGGRSTILKKDFICKCAFWLLFYIDLLKFCYYCRMDSDAPKHLPKLRINDVTICQDRQQWILPCSKAGQDYQKKQKALTPNPSDKKLWDEKTALTEANTRVLATGGHTRLKPNDLASWLWPSASTSTAHFSGC